MVHRAKRIRQGPPISFKCIDSAVVIVPNIPMNLSDGESDHSDIYSETDSTVKNSPYVDDDLILPAQSQAKTWKSEETKAREKFDRARTLLQHYVPEQFKPCAKPSNGPADIVPITFLQYKSHQQEMALMVAKERLTAMETKLARRKVPSVAVAFDGREFDDTFSAVLCQRSVWSTQYKATLEHPDAVWPGRDQLHEDGEKRENMHAPTRCGRFFPALRHPETGRFMQQYPIDQVGPLRTQGPTPAEAAYANREFDSDPAFEACGEELLGEALIGDIGIYQPPFVPDWLAEQRHQRNLAAGRYYQSGGNLPY